jgi:hypothetical protein
VLAEIPFFLDTALPGYDVASPDDQFPNLPLMKMSLFPGVGERVYTP